MIRRAWRRATRTWREAAAIIADVQAPAPGNTRVPAPSPVPGQQEAPRPAHDRVPVRPAPAPAQGGHFTHGRRLLTVRFYEDGATCIWDATGTYVATFQGDHDWDRWLRRMTPDARD